jgi:hypothetical protein
MIRKDLRTTVRFEVGETYLGNWDVKHLTFKLLKRKDNICLFERSDGFFELVRLHYINGLDRQYSNGVVVHFRSKEVYPKTKNWKGITTDDRTRAFELFDLIKPSNSFHPKLKY